MDSPKYLTMAAPNELDKFQWNYKKEIRKTLHTGSLILSQPFLNDDIFKRSVCLLCAHSRAEGSFGFIINKTTEYLVGDFIEELESIDIPVYFGGPVAMDSLYVLHDNQLNLKGAQQILDDLYWGGDFKHLAQGLLENPKALLKTKFVLGYSGWDPSQLRKEIIEDSWIVSDKASEFVFSNHENMWKDIMEDMGDLYEHLAKLPESPDLN
jgi:putative transcriptional regulator